VYLARQGKARKGNGDFGILLSSGDKLAISRITAINKDQLGNAWIEAEMSMRGFPNHTSSPTSQTACTINLNRIQAIYALAGI